ncbi:MAG: transporter substrate-binding domain-containing protein [Pseudomonadota bacterium]
MGKLAGIIFLFIFSSGVSAQKLEDIKWITEEYPPYNYATNQVADGLAVELLVEMWKRVGLTRTKKDIKILPWTRGVRAIKNEPGVSLFSATLTAERTEDFGWKFVFPIPQISDLSNHHLLARKGQNIKFESLEQLQAYGQKFGVVRNDVGGDLLRDAGVSERAMDPSPDADTLIKKLGRGRIEVISYGLATAQTKMREQGLNPDDYEVVFTFPRKPMGYAFHRDTDPHLLRQLQDALNTLIADGTAEKIRLKYAK